MTVKELLEKKLVVVICFTDNQFEEVIINKDNASMNILNKEVIFWSNRGSYFKAII